MKIWIDLTNSPHVLFFKPLIKELQKKHKIIITARDYQQTIPLLKKYKLKFTQLGKHHGKGWTRKFIGTLLEIIQRLEFIAKTKPDLSITHQSFYATIAAFLTGRKSLYIFDGDGSYIQMSGIIYATKSLCPEAIKKKRIFLRKLTKYPGLKEEVYLSDYKQKEKQNMIFLRPEATQASYIKKENILDNLIEQLQKEKYKLVLMPRTPDQREYYKDFKNLEVPELVDGPDILSRSSLVISGGGTMNREAVVLGTPVISIFQNKPLSIDRWLIHNKYMNLIKEPTLQDVKNTIKSKNKYIKSSKGKEFILETINNMLK